MKKRLAQVTVGLVLLQTIVLASPQVGKREQTPSRALLGTLKGRIIDEEVKSPIAGVSVGISGNSSKTMTDAEGRFSIPNLPVGGYSVELTCPLYRSRTITDVIVKSARITFLEAELKLDLETALKAEITVRADSVLDSRSAGEAGFIHEEIRRAVGAEIDISRIVNALPSVSPAPDPWKNSLIVRGGSPAENAFYLDNIEIPNINHFPAFGSTGGAIGLLQVGFIRDLRLSAGGFPALYGDRLSSVMEIAFREGNRDEVDFELDLSLAGVGVIAEGPLGTGRGSWLLSARRSYLDLIIDLLGQGVAPNYGDVQGKIVYDLTRNDKLTLLGVSGLDRSGTDVEDAVLEKEPTYGDYDTSEHAAGINWLHQWGASGYSMTSFSHSGVRYQGDFRWTASTLPSRRDRNAEGQWALRNVNNFRISDGLKLGGGLEIKNQTADYDSLTAAAFDVLGRAVPETGLKVRSSAWLASGFLQATWNPRPRWTLNLGLRGETFSLSPGDFPAPRLSVSWAVTPKTALEFSAGLYRQHLPLPLLLQNESFRTLHSPEAIHLIAGFRRSLPGGAVLTIEAYDKEYHRIPLDPDEPSLYVLDETAYGGYFSHHDRLLDTGRARSYGLEILLQKRLTSRLYGLFGMSFFRARYQGLDGIWRNRAYDNRFLCNLEGGWKAGRGWEFSLKTTLGGGAPYSVIDEAASRAAGSGIFDASRINLERLPASSILNLRGEKRWAINRTNLTLYVSILNVLAQRNILSYYWNTLDDRVGAIRQWGILPTLGLQFEF